MKLSPLPPITFGTILRILLASLVVGMAMAWFDLQPRDVLHWITGNIDEAIANVQAWIVWGIKYVLLGAVIVVPIWAIGYLLRFLRGR
ncbi:DUF6460 domain-containing protein [Benzoatithermus flavus]|uniref:DUF6460 domain-containing protein n=1 Tax=Benzoatithermus flavus TaxID=3108223 RepID=A0ABU8XMR6_9PROT